MGHRVAFVGFAALLVPFGLTAQDTPAPAPAKSKPQVYDAKADIAAAVARAKRDHKRVIVQIGANWCGWCVLLHEKLLQDRALAATLKSEFEYVLVDVGRMDKNMDLVAKYGVELKSIPYLLVLDGDDKVVVRQPTEPLEEGKAHSSAAIAKFLDAHKAPPVDAAKVVADALARAKAEDKLVFLHFGAPWCGWCHRLEDWMASPTVAPVLARQFVDCKVDIDRMAGGKDVQKKWRTGDGGGIPWFSFVDGAGVTKVTSDGPKGNVGFPAKADEIEHFVAMLKTAATKLDADAIALLAKSLEPKPVKSAKEK
jgi:thiol-disulfide isomerase/thioredoxin